MNTLGVFVFYDKHGIVDDYVILLLQGLSTQIDRLIIVYNGLLTKESRDKLSAFSDEIIGRENKGFDAEAWKDVIVNYLGEGIIKSFDRVILFNDTFYGPLYPINDVFNVMNNRKVDFWGITIHSKNDDTWGICPYGYIPEHIQSYFIVFNKNIVQGEHFFSYWSKLKDINLFEEAVCYNEACLTKYFYDNGYSYDVFCDTRSIDKHKGYANNFYAYEPLLLLKQFKCPIIKRKTLQSNCEYDSSLKYIKTNYPYNINAITQNIDRLGGVQVGLLNIIKFQSKKFAKRHFPCFLIKVLRKIQNIIK